MKKYYLYSRDSKGKVRVFIITVKGTFAGFHILRESGLLDGKLTSQPELTINEGKAKRTVREQAILKVKSIISSQRDKGYKAFEELTKDMNSELIKNMELNYVFVNKLLPSDKTDANGKKKPMLAKDTNVLKTADKEKGTNKFDLLLGRAWWASYKFDGIRAMAEPLKGKMDFTSKTGKSYKGVTKHFAEDKQLIAFCEKYKCGIDGEFYVHGMPLKDINGHCQKQEYVPERHDQIKLYIFDMPVEGMDNTQRMKILNEVSFENPRIVVVKHKYLVGKEECLAFEKEAVDLGYEGAMIMDTISMYDFGKRSNSIWKLKPFQDAEGTITGISEGLRDEDMCFIMLTEDGVEFKASIMMTREEKLEVRNDIDNWIGKRGTYKFQYFTPDGKPFLPKFKCLRNDDE